MISKFKLKPLSALVISGALCLFAGDVSAQVRAPEVVARNYSIPAQPLAAALTMLGIQGDIQIVFSSSIVENLTTTGLNGSFSLNEAFNKLLENTDLKHEFISKTSVIIVKDETKSTPSTPAPKAKTKESINSISIDRPQAIEDVIVTGSRIPRSQFDSPYPTQAIGQMEIRDGGHTTIADAINTLPVMCEPNFSLNNLSAGNLGESYGDLYCLGSQRTLSLINSRRSVSSNEPSALSGEPGLQVDLNMIPRIMVDNVEVIGVGSAPVYGSDAIGGTVNVLLKSGVDGFEIDMQGGISDYRDGEQGNIGVLFGRNFFSDRGNLTLGYEFYQQEEVLATNRRYTASNFGYVGVAADANANYTADFRFVGNITNPLLTREGIPTLRGDQPPRFAIGTNELNSTNGVPVTFDTQGRLRQFIPGETTLDIDARLGGEGIRSQDNRLLRIPAQRHSLSGTADFQILSGLRAFVEFQYYSAEFESIGRTREVVSSRLNPNFNSLPLSSSNPFLNAADSAFLQSQLQEAGSQQVFFLHKDWSPVFDSTFQVESNVARIVVGFDGEFSLANRDWQWELSYNQGRSVSQTYSTGVDLDRFETAVGAVPRDEGGVFVTPLPCLGDCIPLNPFGLNQDPAAIEYVSTREFNENEIEQQIGTFSLSGELMSLNGGPWRMVVGLEGRQEEAMLDELINADEPRLPQPESESNSQSSLRVIPESFSTGEIFIESIAPLLGNEIISGVDKFEIEANWRGVDNSRAGMDDAWAVGARLTLAPSAINGTLVLRSNLTSSIRSPSILELFQPLSAVPTAIVQDPCDKDFVNDGDSPDERKRNCIEEASLNSVDLSDGFSPESYDSDTFESQVPRLAPLSLGGTQALRNEQAQSSTAGFVYQYDGDNPFKFSFDTINIEVEDAITQRDLQAVLEDCYDRGEKLSCDDVLRTSTFQLFAIENSYENIGRLKVSAFQYTFEYDFSLEHTIKVPGEFSLDLSAYNLKEFVIEDANGIEDRSGNIRYPKWRTSTTLGYSWNNVSLAWSMLHTSGVEINTSRSDAPQTPEVDAYFFHTFAAQYDFNDYFSARFNVQNVLDSDLPQGLPSENTGSTYDAVGRYFSLGLNFKI